MKTTQTPIVTKASARHQKLMLLLGLLLLGWMNILTVSAQAPVTWASYTLGPQGSVTGNSVNVTGGGSWPSGYTIATSKNVLPACQSTGYAQAKLGVPAPLFSGSYTEAILCLDADGAPSALGYYDYAIAIKRDYGSSNYTLLVGSNYVPGGYFYPTPTTYSTSAIVTPVFGNIFGIQRSGTTISFYMNPGANPAFIISGVTAVDLKVTALVLGSASPSYANDVQSSFGIPSTCGSGGGAIGDNDWAGAGSGTMVPFNSTDNVSIQARLGIGVTSPVEKLEVGGKVKISTIDNDNALTKFLVADATGLVKYRDLATFPEAMDWRTTANAIPTSLNDQIYKNGRVGINTSPNASLHILNGTCDNVPAFRITANDPNFLCAYPNTNGPLMLIETYAGAAKLIVNENGLLGINTASPSYQVDIAGSGRITAAWIISDKRFKKNIEALKDPLALIKKMKGYTYEFRKDEFKERNFSDRKTLGFIAQELNEVVPEAVDLASDGYYAVNYDAIVPLLTEGIKKQQELIENLQQEVESLKSQLNEGTRGEGNQTVSDGTTIGAVLYQNVPNPFHNQTEIRYFLPAGMPDGRLLIFDMNGKQLKSIALTEGEGKVTISGRELTPGMYLYSLIAAGKEIDTKRMILTD